MNQNWSQWFLLIDLCYPKYRSLGHLSCHFDSFSCVHTRTKFKLGQSLLIAKHPQLSEIKLFNHLLKKARKTGKSNESTLEGTTLIAYST